MAVDERRRKVLYDALEQRIGAEAADTMMELLPPVGWADVARRQDLEMLRSDLRAEMERGFRRMIQWNVGTIIAMTSIVLAIVQVT